MPVIGFQQSPIKIETNRTLFYSFGPNYLDFRYNKPLPGTICEGNFEFEPPQDQQQAESRTVRISNPQPVGEVGGPGRDVWIIRKVHMHAPAEHLIDSTTPRDFEVHLVHSLPADIHAEKEKLVVGVFAHPDANAPDKPILRGFINSLRQHRTDKRAKSTITELDPRELLPDTDRDSFFRYEGSLTGGEHTENVSWFVMTGSAGIPVELFHELQAEMNHPARSAQPLERRFVLRSF